MLTRYQPSIPKGVTPVAVSTKGMLYHGWISAFNGIVLVLEHPRGGKITLPAVSIKRVAPLPAGAKI